MNIDFFTIGVYGSTRETFFTALIENKIDVFIDIRQRRAVRGSKYSYVNSTALQENLKHYGIRYLHVLELAPTKEIRLIQKKIDAENNLNKRDRKFLDSHFVSNYRESVLNRYDFSKLFSSLKSIGCEKAVLFCVEQNAYSCHRSIVADELRQKYNFEIHHL